MMTYLEARYQVVEATGRVFGSQVSLQISRATGAWDMPIAQRLVGKGSGMTSNLLEHVPKVSNSIPQRRKPWM